MCRHVQLWCHKPFCSTTDHKCGKLKFALCCKSAACGQNLLPGFPYTQGVGFGNLARERVIILIATASQLPNFLTCEDPLGQLRWLCEGQK